MGTRERYSEVGGVFFVYKLYVSRSFRGWGWEGVGVQLKVSKMRVVQTLKKKKKILPEMAYFNVSILDLHHVYHSTPRVFCVIHVPLNHILN